MMPTRPSATRRKPCAARARAAATSRRSAPAARPARRSTTPSAWQGLDAWGRYYGDVVFDPFTGAGFVDQSIAGSINPFINTLRYGDNPTEPLANGSSSSSLVQALLLDPQLLAAPSRGANLVRYPFVEASVGAGFVADTGDEGWTGETEIQGFQAAPFPWSIYGVIRGTGHRCAARRRSGHRAVRPRRRSHQRHGLPDGDADARRPLRRLCRRARHGLRPDGDRRPGQFSRSARRSRMSVDTARQGRRRRLEPHVRLPQRRQRRPVRQRHLGLQPQHPPGGDRRRAVRPRSARRTRSRNRSTSPPRTASASAT